MAESVGSEGRAMTSTANLSISANVTETASPSTQAKCDDKLDIMLDRHSRMVQRMLVRTMDRPQVVPKERVHINDFYQPQVVVDEVRMVGVVQPRPGSSTFVVMEMVPADNLGPFTDFKVRQVPPKRLYLKRAKRREQPQPTRDNGNPMAAATGRKKKRQPNKVREVELNEGLWRMGAAHAERRLRLARSDLAREQQAVIGEAQLLRHVHSELEGSALAHFFPKVSHAGYLNRMLYKKANPNAIDEDCFLELRPGSGCRPYAILDRHHPTFSEVLPLYPTNTLDLYSARSLTVGVISALRALHGLGYVHRAVCPSNFSVIRRGPSADLNNCQVQCTSLWMATRFKKKRSKKRTMFRGTYMFSSPEAMVGLEHLPNDDLISALYMFCYLTAGNLPWGRCKLTNPIFEAKLAFHKEPRLCENQLKLNRLTQAFDEVYDYNPHLSTTDAHSRVIRILNDIINDNRTFLNNQTPLF